MKPEFLRRLLPRKRRWCLLPALLLVAVGLATAGAWFPGLRQLVAATLNGVKPAQTADDGRDHAEEAAGAHNHGEAGHGRAGEEPGAHAGEADGRGHASETGGEAGYDHVHDEASAIKLSQQAQGNIGLRTTKVELKPFERTITVPGMIVERPGWSTIEITAPMTGIVTRIYPIQGEAIEPGQSLFEVRLTHEDLLQSQTEFLRTVEELDVIGREVARLEKVSADGVIAGKALLERKYEQQKQEAALRAQRQALLLHGLSKDQVDNIASTRTLLQSLTIRAPVREKAAQAHPLHVQELKVSQGKYVSAGDTLCKLADYGELYIEGQAFEQDIGVINKAASSGCGVSAILGSKSAGDEEVSPGLCILYLDDKVDPESRALHFYVALPNRILREDKAEGRCFVYWQFRPGQRTQIRIPVEQWKDRIVLPLEAVAQEGAEAYVFEANDDHFDRRPVRIEYRDQDWVVIANDGVLKVGAMVAASAAHQMQLALKTRAGGGVDPHAGHNH